MDYARLLMMRPGRPPTRSEDAFFSDSRHVAGYAAPDGAVVLNPYSPPEVNRDAVHLLESARHQMFDDGRIFSFDMTPEQNARLRSWGGPYSQQPQMARHTTVSRILAGDSSLGPYTPAQQAAAQGVLDGLLFGR
jgi:hypothetical protein